MFPLPLDPSSPNDSTPHDAWECADCGWTLRQAQLPPDIGFAEALEAHGEMYCARPSAFPQG